MPSADSPSKPRTKRQREIMAAGAQLFARRGYHAVGINDVCAELGLTGPAFYRHFGTKDALLVAILDDAISDHLESVQDLVVQHVEPLPRLEAIVGHHIDFVFDQGDAIMVWRREARVLPDSERSRIGYLQKLYVQQWVRTLRQLRPELDTETATLVCTATIALIQSSVRFSALLDRARLSPLLQSMAMTGLTAQLPVSG